MCDHADATSQLPWSGGLMMTECLLAADHLKMNFPMAWAASVLAWGFIEFQDVSAIPSAQLNACDARAPISHWHETGLVSLHAILAALRHVTLDHDWSHLYYRGTPVQLRQRVQ